MNRRIVHSVDEAKIKEKATEERLPFALTLNRLLEEKELSQKELAKRAGVADGMISEYRKGKCDPGLSAILAMAKALDVDCHYLMTGEKREYLDAHKKTGLSDSAFDFLALLKESNNTRCATSLKAINALLDCNDALIEYWYRLGAYLFEHEKGYNLLTDSGAFEIAPADVLSAFLLINDRFLLDLRTQIQGGGKKGTGGSDK